MGQKFFIRPVRKYSSFSCSARRIFNWNFCPNHPAAKIILPNPKHKPVRKHHSNQYILTISGMEILHVMSTPGSNLMWASDGGEFWCENNHKENVRVMHPNVGCVSTTPVSTTSVVLNQPHVWCWKKCMIMYLQKKHNYNVVHPHVDVPMHMHGCVFGGNVQKKICLTQGMSCENMCVCVPLRCTGVHEQGTRAGLGRVELGQAISRKTKEFTTNLGHQFFRLSFDLVWIAQEVAFFARSLLLQSLQRKGAWTNRTRVGVLAQQGCKTVSVFLMHWRCVASTHAPWSHLERDLDRRSIAQSKRTQKKSYKLGAPPALDEVNPSNWYMYFQGCAFISNHT